MPSVRSLILLSILLLVISLVAGFVSLLQAPDSDGMGQDSYGTRGFGYRAVYDLLRELDIKTRRNFSPPEPDDTSQTLVLLQPDPSIAGTEPTYLHRLLPWVERGGRLVVSLPRSDQFNFHSLMSGPDVAEMPSVQESLGISAGTESQTSPEFASRKRRRRADDDESLTDELLNAFGGHSPPQVVNVKCEGSLEKTAMKSVSVSRDEVQTLDCTDLSPLGTITYTPEDEPKVLVAEFARGAGRIIVVADHAIFQNRHLARGDNSVLTAKLLSPDGQVVVFDEFYHGLGVRGNPLYLMTRPGYAALALGLLLITCLVVWRQAIFLGPSLPDQPIQRRDIAEYLTAMGRFFSYGRETYPFLIEQIRAGVLRELCRKLSLATETHDVELIAGMISRRDPKLGERIRQTIAEIDGELTNRSRWTESETIDAMRRLTACLSTHT